MASRTVKGRALAWYREVLNVAGTSRAVRVTPTMAGSFAHGDLVRRSTPAGLPHPDQPIAAARTPQLPSTFGLAHATRWSASISASAGREPGAPGFGSG